MAFDGVVLHAVIDELSGLLTGGRVEKIFQPEPGELVLLIHASSEHYRLLLSADPASARIHLTRNKKENPALPPPFCMVLRKYLTGARLSAVRQQGFDRVAVLEFETRNEMGDNEIKRLVLEIMNRQSNIILLNSAGTIHDAIRHADFSVNRYREIMPARPYTPPPAQDKISPLELTPELIKRTLSEAAAQTVSKCLLSVAAGFSPMLCDAICIDADIDPAAPPAALKEGETERLINSLDRAAAQIAEGAYKPAVLKDGKEFHCMRACCNAYSVKSTYNTVNLAVDSYYTEKGQAEKLEREKAAVARRISANVEKLSKKLEEYGRELDAAADFAREKELGELLTAQLYNLPEYAGSVTLTDFYAAESPEITLELDPSRTVAGNAQLYFKRYRKHRATVENVSKLADSVRLELDYLDNLKAMLDNSTGFDEIADIREEVYADEAHSREKRGVPGGNGDTEVSQKASSKGGGAPVQPLSAYLGGKPASKKSLRARANAAKAKSAAGKGGKGGGNGAIGAGCRDIAKAEEVGLTKPIQRFSPSGKRILIGRNARQNEKLTLRDAAPEDLWFHVKNAPGSHVVLKLKESGVNTASDADIEVAAALAAYYSSQRSGSKVNVDFTAVKNVKKIPGGKPGMVTYSDFRTVTVRPEDVD